MNYISPKEIAIQIREELKEAFPRIKFSVTSEARGSVRVKWTDGPTPKAVEAITGKHGNVDRCDASGEILSGGNVFVNTSRDISPKAIARVDDHLCEYWVGWPEMSSFEQGKIRHAYLQETDLSTVQAEIEIFKRESAVLKSLANLSRLVEQYVNCGKDGSGDINQPNGTEIMEECDRLTKAASALVILKSQGLLD